METGTKNGLVMVGIFVAGLLLGYYVGAHRIETALAPSIDTEATQSETGTAIDTDEATSLSETIPAKGVKVDTTKLSDGQKKLLNTLGVDTENLVLTPEMIACAEGKVGAARLAEIQNGATPSFMEGASLVTCYR